MSKFADNIKALRKDRKWSQSELAERLNISKSSVNMYERGEREPNSEMLIKIADLFDVSIDFLIGRSVRGATHYSCGVSVFRASTQSIMDSLTEILIPGEFWVAYSAPGILITVDNDSSASDEDIARIVDPYRESYEQKNSASLCEKERTVGKKELKTALWGDCSDMDDHDLEDVLMYASFVKYRKSQKTPPA